MLIALLRVISGNARKQEVNNVVPQVKGEIVTWQNRRWQIAVTFLEHTSHNRHIATNNRQCLPQRVNKAVAPVAGGSAHVIAHTFDVDVNDFASIPIMFFSSSHLLDIVCEDANSSLADVWHVIAPRCVGVLRGPR